MVEVMTGNEENLAFYFHLGKAITYWQHVEFALYDVLAAASGDEATRDLYIGFLSLSREDRFMKCSGPEARLRVA